LLRKVHLNVHLYARRPFSPIIQPLKAVPIICRFSQCAKKTLPAPA
jgi:hypothetical protein